MAQQLLTGGNGSTGQSGQDVRDIINENFTELFNISTVSITTTAALDETAFGKIHIVTGTTANYTVTLPDATDNDNKTIHFVFSHALTYYITIDGLEGQTINGVATQIRVAGETMTIMASGGNWIIVSEKRKALHAAMSRNESIPNGTGSKTKFALATGQGTNTDNGMINTTDNRIDIPRPGYYKCRYKVSTTTATFSAADDFQISLWKNGSEVSGTIYVGEIIANTKFTAFFEVYPQLLAAGDYLDIRAHQNTGSALTLSGNLIVEEIIS